MYGYQPKPNSCSCKGTPPKNINDLPANHGHNHVDPSQIRPESVLYFATNASEYTITIFFVNNTSIYLQYADTFELDQAVIMMRKYWGKCCTC